MSDRAYAKVPAQQKTLIGSSPKSSLLQRTCACGKHTLVGGECSTCRNEQSTLLRSQRTLGFPPPIVHDVLNSGKGQPLDTTTRAFMEPRFGHDFSKVRVYSDKRAVESARAVNALAYTAGRDVVFGAGQYAPETSAGKRLLAHELTHVVQQQKASNASLQGKLTVSQPDNAHEREAEAQAATVTEEHGAAEGTPPSGLAGQTGHLTSPRFAGDETLEACYQDKGRLREGDQGESVARVQRALVDLGYDLGTTGESSNGVDGVYGPKTTSAVRNFKADQKLGFERYGDVGPGTMHRLDQLFPPGRPLPMCPDLDHAPAVSHSAMSFSGLIPGLSCNIRPIGGDSPTEGAKKAAQRARDLKDQQDPAIWFDSWGNDARDNKLTGTIDGPSEQGISDGVHYKQLHDAKICQYAPWLRTDSLLCSQSMIKVQYKVCIDIPIEAYQAARVPVSTNRNIPMSNFFNDLKRIDGWKVWKVSKDGQPDLIEGDIVAADHPAQNENVHHAGIVAGYKNWIINLPGPTTRRKYITHLPSGRNDILQVPEFVFKQFKGIDWVARLIK